MASKIKVDQIEGAAGSSITIPSGQTLTITDGLAASIIGSGTLADARIPNLNASKINAGTLADAQLPTIPVAKGGTGLTSLGTAGQVVSVNSGANALEFADASSGKVLQTKTATTNSLIQSSSNTGGKHFPQNRGVSDGAQVVSLSITPQSTTSHFYVWFTCASGASGNAVSVLGLFSGSTLLNIASGNNYAADVCGLSVHGIQDTTSLSGAQTIQARNLGTHDGSQHGVNAGGGGTTYNGGIATMTVMEIED